MTKFEEQPIKSLPAERWQVFKTTYQNKRLNRTKDSDMLPIAETKWLISDHGRVQLEIYFYTHAETNHMFKVLKNAGKTMWRLMPFYEKGGHVTKYPCLPTGEYIHRLVAEAYIPNPDGKVTINHIDGNKRNNHYTNLEWATYGENIRHSYQMMKSNGGGKWGRGQINVNK